MRLTGRVESIVSIKQIKPRLHCLKVRIDFDEAYWFYDYTEAMEFLNKTVEYDLREDIYNGKIITVVANIATFNVVQTLTSEENIKLIPDKDFTKTAVCNIDSSSLRMGEVVSNCVAFLASYEEGSSSKASWFDCKAVDMNSKVFDLRIFVSVLPGVDNVAEIEALVGRYITFTVERTFYGIQARDVELYNVTVVEPPEVSISLAKLREILAEDEELASYDAKYNLINHLSKTIYYELGYHLVYIVAEISMINAVCNITDVYNRRSMIRAALCSRGYLLPTKTELSRPLLNVNKILSTSLVHDRELLLILDVLAEEEVSPTKSAYMEIAAFTKRILDERRGIENETKINNGDLLSFRNKFGGLL